MLISDPYEARKGTESVALSPIAAFRSRGSVHRPSNSNLQRSASAWADGSGTVDNPSGGVSSTITEAINHLESLLEEASEISQFFTGPMDKAGHAQSRRLPSMQRTRKPSERILSRGNMYLESANIKRRPTVQFEDRQAAEPNQSNEVDPHDANAMDPAVEVEHLSGPISLPSSEPLVSPREDMSIDEAGLAEHKAIDSAQPAPDSVDSEPNVSDDKSEIAPEQAVHGTSISGGRRGASIDMAHVQNARGETICLRHKTHVDLFNAPAGFDVHESCSHKPVAKDWSDSRKRLTAFVVCINTACLGILIGIYAGEVPAIQYQIADLGHLTILGNVCLYLGLAITNLVCWPLPLLHGRKPYTLAGLAFAFALQIPQGIVVSQWRLPSQITWRVLLLLCRALTGIAFGLVTINVQSSLLDVFGASLQSQHPHGEVVDPCDSRRHGGGMGLWLGAWSWCTIGPISLGFVIGAFIVSRTSVQWGFWVGVCVLMVVFFLNLIAPETRRAAFRRTIAEITGTSGESFSRVTRGEVKMHLKAVGPYWWGEEVLAGLEMCYLMVKQPGFLVLALYSAWTYAQFTLVMMLMGALASRQYQYRPIWVGVCALSLGGGAVLAVPFQKASIFSRSRRQKYRTDSMTYQRSGFWTSHAVRRILFTVGTPLAATGFACTTWGPPFPVAAPCVFAAVVGYMSTLVTAECFGLTMEVFDVSDLQPPRTSARGSETRKEAREPREPKDISHKKQCTKFTCYPRVSAGMAVIQSMGYGLAAAATGLGGRVERSIGIMKASSGVAGILLVLTALLIAVLVRWKEVRVIPSWATTADSTDPSGTTQWDRFVLGRPSSAMRKINILEAGRQSRFTEIRRGSR